MNNCGKRFHSEVAKFRFLNELIKVLTPKVTMKAKGFADVWESIRTLIALFVLFLVVYCGS